MNRGEPRPVKGTLDILPEGYGFLRASGYLPGDDDVYVSLSQIRRFQLRRGDYIEGSVRPPKDSEKYPALLRIDTINGLEPDQSRERPRFDDLTPLFPDQRLRLELTGDGDITQRIIDLISPSARAARLDCFSAEGGKDDDHEADRAIDRDQQSRSAPDGPSCR